MSYSKKMHVRTIGFDARRYYRLKALAEIESTTMTDVINEAVDRLLAQRLDNK